MSKDGESEEKSPFEKMLDSREFMETLRAGLEVWKVQIESSKDLDEKKIELEKEKISLRRGEILAQERSRADQNKTDDKLTFKWLGYSSILYIVTFLGVGLMGWQKIIPDGVAGTIIAGMVGFVFGKATGEKEK